MLINNKKKFSSVFWKMLMAGFMLWSQLLWATQTFNLSVLNTQSFNVVSSPLGGVEGCNIENRPSFL